MTHCLRPLPAPSRTARSHQNTMSPLALACRLVLMFSDGENPRLRSHQQTITRDRRGGHREASQIVEMQQLELLTRGDNESLPFFAETKNVSIVRPWRRRERSGVLIEPRPVANGSRLRVDPAENTVFVEHVQRSIVDDWRPHLRSTF